MKLGLFSLPGSSQGSHDRMSILECLFWGVPCLGTHVGMPVLECPHQECPFWGVTCWGVLYGTFGMCQGALSSGDNTGVSVWGCPYWGTPFCSPHAEMSVTGCPFWDAHFGVLTLRCPMPWCPYGVGVSLLGSPCQNALFGVSHVGSSLMLRMG